MDDFTPTNTLMGQDDREQIQTTIKAFRMASKWLMASTACIVIGTVTVMSFVLDTRNELKALRSDMSVSALERTAMRADIRQAEIKLANIEGRWYKAGQ